MKIVLLLLVALLPLLAMSQIAIVPQPNSTKPGTGKFRITEDTIIVASKETEKLATKARDTISHVPRWKLALRTKGSQNRIAFRIDKRLASKLSGEGYRITVDKSGADLVAAEPIGLFYAWQSFRQLLPSRVFDMSYETSLTPVYYDVPFVEIEDSPRFKWRGAHMDVARHFMSKEFIFKFLDLMAMHKLNVFHWHLTEDQGWRIEIKRYPKLTEIGAWRKDDMLVYDPPKYSGKPHGGFYTQDDLREIVKYAADRFITVVPEIEMPGHAQAAIAAYPELGDGERREVWTKWGVSENVFNVKDSTLDFLKNVLDEIIALFPGPFIHIGGDECPKVQWKKSAFAQAKMQKLGLKDEHELQSWFIRHMDAHLDSKGKRLIGWSEILEGGLAPGAALMVWLGDEGAMEAVSSGHDVVMAQTTHTYFDYYQSRDRAKEPHSIGGFLPLDKVYSYDPILPKMTAEQGKHVMGTQFQLWSEYIGTPDHMEYMAFPRACALAEVAWTQPKNKDFADFRKRLGVHVDRLSAMGVNFRKLDP